MVKRRAALTRVGVEGAREGRPHVVGAASLRLMPGVRSPVPAHLLAQSPANDPLLGPLVALQATQPLPADQTLSVDCAAAAHAAECSALDAAPPQQGARAPFVLAQSVIAGQFDPDVVAWLQEAFRQRERQQGALPLERYLKLPTIKAMRRQRRDYWLSQAALLVCAQHETARCETVASELQRFMTRGPWAAWKRDGAAPADASELQRCLFEAAANHDGRRPPCAKTVERARGSQAGLAATNL